VIGVGVTWSMGASGLYSITNVCDQMMPVHTVVVVMLPTMSSNGTELTTVLGDAIMDNKSYTANYRNLFALFGLSVASELDCKIAAS
jgi:hypothetical protein